MDVLYFAWVRERIGIPREQVKHLLQLLLIWWLSYVCAKNVMNLRSLI